MSKKPDSKITLSVLNPETKKHEPVEIDLDEVVSEIYRLADADDSQSQRYLLEQAADHLYAGQIEDERLREWLAGWLIKYAADLPGTTGGPSEIDAHMNWAIRVEQHRRQIKRDNQKLPKHRREKKPKLIALEQVADEVCRSRYTVEKAIKPLRQWSIDRCDYLESRSRE